MLIVWVPFNTKLEFNFDKNLDVKRILNYSKTKLKKPHNIDSSTQANNLKQINKFRGCKDVSH